MTPDPNHVHIGNWLEQLSDVVIDAEKYLEEHGHEVSEEIRGWLEDAEQRFRDIVCAVAEHIIVDDQCGIPEHRYCIVCNRSQLAIQQRAVTALTRLSEELGLYEATDLDDNPLVRHLARAEETAFGVRVDAPWSEEVVEELRAWQANPAVHAYTCINGSRHRPLVPTGNGWVCEECDYTQTWAISWTDAATPQ